MEEREQRRRCRGQKDLGEVDIMEKASSSIPCAFAMTDAREVREAAQACISLPLEHGVLQLACCSNRDSLSFGVQISANESHKTSQLRCQTRIIHHERVN